jgi:hypothetical protein
MEPVLSNFLVTTLCVSAGAQWRLLEWVHQFQYKHWMLYRVQHFQYTPLDAILCPAVSVYATGLHIVSSSFSRRHSTPYLVQQFQYTPLDAISCPAVSIRHWTSYRVQQSVYATGRYIVSSSQYTPLDAISCLAHNSSSAMACNVTNTRRGVTTVNERI